MPNHVCNILHLQGSSEELNACIDLMRGDEPTEDENHQGRPPVDFNKLIPMPDNCVDPIRWRVEHWGTKWNAYNFEEESTDAIYHYEISFNTAWSTPEPIWYELAKRFPKLDGHVLYADEDLGSNCGEYYWSNGEVCFVDRSSEGRDEALRFSYKVWGYEYDPETDECTWIGRCDDTKEDMGDMEVTTSNVEPISFDAAVSGEESASI